MSESDRRVSYILPLSFSGAIVGVVTLPAVNPCEREEAW